MRDFNHIDPGTVGYVPRIRQFPFFYVLLFILYPNIHF